ncbi:hypothetical protein Dimus_013732 [Dionaea muscipula]
MVLSKAQELEKPEQSSMAWNLPLVLLLLIIFLLFVLLPGPVIIISQTINSPPPLSSQVSSTLRLSLPPPPPRQPSSSSPPPQPHHPQQQRQRPLVEIQETHLKRIIEALIGSGDFSNWAGVLSSTDPSILPISATLFIPHDDAVLFAAGEIRSPGSNGNGGVTVGVDPLVFPYHVVPQRLTFSELSLFPVDSRLPTLIPGKTLLVTHNSVSKFAIDDSPITHPDLFLNAAVSAHGVGAIFNYTLYGNQSWSRGDSRRQSSPSPPGHSRRRPSPGWPFTGGKVFPSPISPAVDGQVIQRSDAACYYSELPIGFVSVVVCSVLAFTTQRSLISR